MAAKTYLLDTHCVIWFQENNPKIPARIMSIIQDTDNKVFFSQISLFEIAIKQKIGKLPGFTSNIVDVYNQAVKDGFSFLPVYNSHLYCYDKIPLIKEHRDPFDRLLIATALAEAVSVLTADKNFSFYKNLIAVDW